MAIEFENPLTAGTVLVRSDIRSQNYVASTSGWIIEAGGDAEFNNLTIRGVFEGNTFVLNSDGLFLYDGTPALGNLIASIAPAPGTDGFGNVYLDGIVTYAGTDFAALNVGNLLVGVTAAGYAPAGLVGLSGSDGLFASSPTSGAKPSAATWSLVDGDTTVTPQSASGYPHFDVGAATAGVTQWINGAIVRSTVSGGVSTAETWHNPTFSGTWSATGTLNGNLNFQGLQYRKDAEDNVWLSGGATTTGAGGSVFTLPPGYFNANKRHLVPCWIFDSSAGTVTAGFAQVTETGIVNIAATLTGITIAAGDQIYLNGKFPLGNVA